MKNLSNIVPKLQKIHLYSKYSMRRPLDNIIQQFLRHLDQNTVKPVNSRTVKFAHFLEDF